MVPLVWVIQHLFREMTATSTQVTRHVGILPKTLNMKSSQKERVNIILLELLNMELTSKLQTKKKLVKYNIIVNFFVNWIS
jgi:hypothetical protein